MLRHMHKMDAVGQLTGGVAHDFNNLLSVIIGSAERAKRRLAGPEHPQIASGLDAMLEGAHRAATLVSRLLAFSRQQPLQPENLDINDLILGMSDMLHRTLGENIRVETELAGNLWPCVADRSELENAILNLAVNARDAMPGGGKLIVETANAALDERYAAAHTDVRPGQYVMISVCDTGSGMPPAVLEKAFEPFFTTKGVGKGTGLGLSQVFGYARQSGGHVKIYSEVGHGTVVKLYLPRLALSAAQPPTEVRGTAREIAAGSKDTVILIVEDDPQVRATSVASVLELGYGVLEASGPKDALQILQREKISLLFTDVIMPEMSGRQLAEQAKASNPDLRVLYTTGYSRNAIVHNGALDPGIMLLPKPYTLAQLAAKLTEALA
jgi:CheY-like chemotaxis protein